jgi:hypothetical protein
VGVRGTFVCQFLISIMGFNEAGPGLIHYFSLAYDLLYGKAVSLGIRKSGMSEYGFLMR